MKERILRHLNRTINMPEFIAGSFVLLIFTVYLFVFNHEGYRNITMVKYISFLSLSGVFIAAMFVCNLCRRISGRWDRTVMNLTELFVVIYMLLSVFSALASDFFPNTLLGDHRREGALTICIYGLIFLYVERSIISAKWIIYVLGTVISFFSAVCILQFFRVNVLGLFPEGLDYYDAGIEYSGQFLGTLGNAGLTAAFLCLTVPILLIYIARANEKLRWWLIIPTILGTVVLFASKIAAGIVGFLAGIFVAMPFILTVDKEKRRILIGVETIIVIAFLAAVYFLDFEMGTLNELHCILHGSFDDSFGSSRIFIWRNTLPLIPEHPLLGGGPDTLADRIGVIFETIKDDGTVRRASIDAAHNEYLNIAVCQGIPALIAYLAAVFTTLTKFIKYRTQDSISAALAVGMVCYCMQAFFGISIFISSIYFWIIWALLEQRLNMLRKNNGSCETSL